MSTDCTSDIEQHYRRAGEFIIDDSLPLIAETVFWNNVNPLALYVESVVLTVVVLCLFYQTREIFLSGMFDGDGLDSVLYRARIVASVYSILTLFMSGRDPGSQWPFRFSSYSDGLDDDTISNFGPAACLATSASALVLSFCTNLSATLMIFYTAWSYYTSQRALRDTTASLRRSSQVARVLLLLVESGFAYFLLMILSIAVNLVPTSDYGPALVVEEVLSTSLTSHCVAMVPTLTILLVTLYGSFEEYSIGNISQPIHFATPRVTQLAEESILSRTGQPESDAEANDSHSSNVGQERKIKAEK
ncbi:hypothetical protein C8J56DRAFT_1105190 [Mycena floridula]|nr:hypothetical protein C8J56DRAFT_1105190 [Mycena floridula]